MWACMNEIKSVWSFSLSHAIKKIFELRGERSSVSLGNLLLSSLTFPATLSLFKHSKCECKVQDAWKQLNLTPAKRNKINRPPITHASYRRAKEHVAGIRWCMVSYLKVPHFVMIIIALANNYNDDEWHFALAFPTWLREILMTRKSFARAISAERDWINRRSSETIR